VTDDPIERLRAHVEKHAHHQQAFFSTAGLKTLLEELDRLQGALATCRELLERRQGLRDGLKAQIDRLLAAEAKRIEEALLYTGSIKQEETGQ
jgi:hypothetical protein